MLISLLLLAGAAAGGFAITYLIDDDAKLLWRVAAGNVIGSAVFGTVGFILALGVGLSVWTVAAAFLLSLLPIILLRRGERRKRLSGDWSRAKGNLQGGSSRKFLRFAYYAFFFLLFFFFFDRTMLESAAGIFTGGSQNLGDLSFHLGAIFSFTEANNFPPQNPSFAGARFSYPFIADILTAFAMKLGAGVRDAMFLQNLSWAMSLLIILERFVYLLTTDRLAARIAPFLLFFSGGLGFVWFLSDYWAQAKSFFDFIGALPKDYTISDSFRWGNSMVVLFMTQRSLLLGLPLTLLVVGYLWKVFAAGEMEKLDRDASGVSESPRLFFSPRRLLDFPRSPIVIGLIAGLLPLIHLHSLVVLFVIGVSLFVLMPEKWPVWITFATAVAVVAVSELVWSMSGSANNAVTFFAWRFGWDKGQTNFFWFWFVNTGLVIPILIAGIYLTVFRPKTMHVEPSHSRKAAKKSAATRKKDRNVTEDASASDRSQFTRRYLPLLWFYLPFAFLFVVSNIAKLAPWQWDNIKVLIYWFVGSLPFITLFIAWLWESRKPVLRAAAAVCLIVLTASGALDVWRTVSGQINYKVFDMDAVEIAKQLKVRTPPDALFLNAPTYNTAVALTGRQSLMRYTGHLNSHGIDYGAREADVKQIYQGGPNAGALLDKYGINYVLVSPEERNLVGVNEQYFSRYPVAAESGQYRAYKIR